MPNMRRNSGDVPKTAESSDAKTSSKRSGSLDAVIVATVLAAAAPEAPPVVAQTISAQMSWTEGVAELERFAEDETPEGIAIYVEFGEEPGKFVDLVTEPGLVRDRDSIFVTGETLAGAIGRAYMSGAFEPPIARMRVLQVHTHPAALMSRIDEFGPLFTRLAERRAPITLAPSPTDVRNAQADAEYAVAVRARFPGIAAERVQFEFAVMDSIATYRYRPLTQSERAARGLLPVERQHEDITTPWGRFTFAVRETLRFIDTLDAGTKVSLAGASTESDLEMHLVSGIETAALDTLYRILQEHRRQDLVLQLQTAAREQRAYIATLDVDVVRGQWATYVADSLAHHRSWDDMRRSAQYRALQDHYARYFNVDLEVFSNEEVQAQPPFPERTVAAQ